jgi:hypothetical protein
VIVFRPQEDGLGASVLEDVGDLLDGEVVVHRNRRHATELGGGERRDVVGPVGAQDGEGIVDAQPALGAQCVHELVDTAIQVGPSKDE